MKNVVTTALLLFSTILCANNGSQLFHEGGYLGAQKQAIEEGKFQMIEFVAQWCLPCKHMDQTTFTDVGLINYMEQHFVSAKVDIDDFDGFALKQQYDIRFLPSIIILDEQGKVIARYEEAMGPDKLKSHLVEVVQKNQKPAPRTTKTRVSGSLEKPKPQKNVSKEIVEQVEPEEKVFLTDKVVLQFGVFSRLSNAEKLYDQISEYLPSTPEMKPIERGSQTIYALRYGPFTDKVEAEELKEELTLLGYDCIIKKMEL